MELTIQRGELLKGLARTQGIADRKTTMPILAHALLSAEGKNKLVVSATDLSVSVRGSVTAHVKKPGAMSAQAKTLFEVVRSLPDEEIQLKLQENQRLLIRCGKVEYKINGMSDKDYPKIPDTSALAYIDVDGAILRDMIDKTLFSVSHDDTRYHLSGVYVEADGDKLRMVSTDGHRLSRVERLAGAGKLGLKEGVIIPHKGVGEVRRLIDEEGENVVGVAIKDGSAHFRKGDVTLSVKLIDAKFPDYGQVIPRSSSQKAVLKRAPFLEALRRISLLASGDRSGGVKLDLTKGTLRVSSDNPDLGEGQEEVSAEFDGAQLRIGFNARYLVDALGASDSDEVSLELNDDRSPGLLRPVEDEGYICVVMPIRL
jgi:DNA polymerase-3 subunit beta